MSINMKNSSFSLIEFFGINLIEQKNESFAEWRGNWFGQSNDSFFFVLLKLRKCREDYAADISKDFHRHIFLCFVNWF